MAKNQRAEIQMTHDEIVEFLRTSRSMTMATVGPTGHPHLVAMWYALVDNTVWFETKRKSQKVKNLLRDPRITCSVEAGRTYDTLRGVALEGTAEVVDDPDALWQVGVSTWERYQGPYSEEVAPLVRTMLNNRVAVKVNVERTRSWDHRKMNMPAMEAGGTTAGEPS